MKRRLQKTLYVLYVLFIGPLGWIGGFLGFGTGIAYSAYRDHYVHFQLRTDFVGPNDKSVRTIALEKANYIFKEYAKQKTKETNGTICDDLLTCELFIYPVKAGDGHVYEHSAIYRYLTENYPAALQDYENKCARFPHEAATLRRPSSSPVGSGEVTLASLKLDIKKMKLISEMMANFFEKLDQYCLPMQTTVDESYQRDRFCVLSVPQTTLSPDAVLAVDEKALALKLYGEQSAQVALQENPNTSSASPALSLEEIFVIK